jgi:hypothetical protein
LGIEREASALVGILLGFGDNFQTVFPAADAGVDPQVERLEEAEGMFFEEDLDPGGIVVMVEQGHGFADELDGGFEEAAV